ncbi:Transcriptional regulator, AbiEi antitoxin, Type IV TA system [Cryptosporangium aurantiacum]|uniref:Transcriptional regulator, AbiEi antitoxin, Type IV TA system n=2 Tax=Cryptosporangium aurantiacum TaxID=134849 RepID=A0A1M7R731_9ACTN|nr:Transcriptional regulator, AbiEi antitoxin, Type IV TA system [Cryptosporangium aurantiacum]
MAWEELLRRQQGAVSRGQLIGRGFSRGDIAAHLAAGRWRCPIPGIYVTFTGPLPVLTRYWVALLHAGTGAVLSHTTAGAIWRLLPDRGEPVIHLTIPRPRNVRSRRGLVVHRTRIQVVPVGSPPCTGVARTAIDVCVEATDPAGVAAVLGRVAQQYHSVLEEVRELALGYPTMPRRAEFLAVLDDVSGGAHSALEWHYLVDVERAHGLPSGTRQRPVGGTRQDVHLDEYRTTIELDGRVVHQRVPAAWRDMIRDNAAARRGETTLRYGWQDVRWRPCAIAAEVAAILRARGWTGAPTACGPGCPLGPLEWTRSG